MINEIKKYKELVEVEITDFSGNTEILYWEGSITDFSGKYQSLKAIVFPMDNGRVIDVNRIQGFQKARVDEKNLNSQISCLDFQGQAKVKLKVKEYKRRFGEYPSEGYIDNVIQSILNPYREQIKDYERSKKSEKIRQEKKKIREYYDGLNSEQQTQLDNEIWFELNKKHINIAFHKDSITSKSLFIAKKNEIIKNKLVIK